MKTRINGLPFGLFRFFKYQKCPKIPNFFYPVTQMEHDQSSYFCRGPDDFCWGPATMGPTLVTGLNFATVSRSCCQQSTSTVEVVDDTYYGKYTVSV